jgi:hypothetical protein
MMASIRKNGLWIIFGLVVVVGVSSFIFFYLNRNIVVPASWGNEAGARNQFPDGLNILQQAFLFPIVTALLGVLIVRRYSRHRVGWLLVATGLTSGAVTLFAEYTVYGYFTSPEHLPGVEWTAWFTNWIWVAFFSFLLYTLAIFPNGQFLSAGWRKVLTLFIAWFAFFLFAGAAVENTMSSAFQITNPLNINFPGWLYDYLFYFGLPAMPLTAVALLISAVIRFRRGQGRERQQMKWLLGGVALLAISVVTGLTLSLWVGSAYGEIIVNGSGLWPVLGIGVALLRHKLYDIDIIFRRTLIYALVSALLALLYFGSVVVLQGVVSVVGGRQSGIVVAVSTLVIAALFSPVRRRVQILVDRRFYRRSYNAAQTLNRFAAAARDEVEMNKLAAALVHTVQETMQPEQISLWLKTESDPRKNGFS